METIDSLSADQLSDLAMVPAVIHLGTLDTGEVALTPIVLARALRIKAAMITLGELIELGSETPLMEAAAFALEKLDRDLTEATEYILQFEKNVKCT